MDDPAPELRADATGRDDAPDFDAVAPPEDLVRGERTRDDFFDAVLQLDDPATVDEVADLANHGADAAREYLRWFERMGIVTRVTESPATYRCNREYLAWRRVQSVRRSYDREEIVARLDAEVERDRSYAEEFGVDAPTEVSLSERATDSGLSVEDVWERLSGWKTTRRRIEILERALGDTTGSSEGRRQPA